MHRSLAWALLATLALLPSACCGAPRRLCCGAPAGTEAPPTPPTPPTPRPPLPTTAATPWTFALYVAADAPDGCALAHVLEAFALAAASPHVQVIAFVDQAPYGCDDGFTELAQGTDVLDLPADPGGRLVRVHPGSLEALAWPGLTEPSTASPATLTTFLDAVARVAPSERLALWTFSHGHGCKGVCADETARRAAEARGDLPGAEDASALTFEELRLGLQGSARGGVDLAVFVGCSVGCLELVHELHGVAPWIVASESPTELGSISYGAVLEAVAQDAAIGPAALGQRIVETHELSTGFACAHDRVGGGIALYDASVYGRGFEPFAHVLDELSRALASPDRGPRVARALLTAGAAAWGFACGKAGPCVVDGTTGQCCMRDVGNLLALLAADGTDGEVAQRARIALAALPRLVPCATTSPAEAGTHGISVYLPCAASHLPAYEALGFPAATGWGDLLARALSLSSCPAECPVPLEPELRVQEEEGRVFGTVTARIKGDPAQVRGAWLVGQPAAPTASPYGQLLLAPLTVDVDTATVRGRWDGSALAAAEPGTGQRPLLLFADDVESGFGAPLTSTARVRLQWFPSDVCQGCPQAVEARYELASAGAGPATLVRLSAVAADGPGALGLRGGDVLMLEGGALEAAHKRGLPALITVGQRLPQARFLPLPQEIGALRCSVLFVGTFGGSGVQPLPAPVTPPHLITR